MTSPSETRVTILGRCTVESPLGLSTVRGDSIANFVGDGGRVLIDPVTRPGDEGQHPAFELAGPRREIFFDPSKVRAGIVTCGGICPGLNNVIRGLVMQLWHRYGVRRIVGFRYGLRGFVPRYRLPLVDLAPDVVVNIHHMGGTILGSSRGPQDIGKIADLLERQDFDMVFFVGGDGTLRAAHAVSEEIQRRGLKISIVGVPKTIDNDILHVERSFGVDTAVSVATEAANAAHAEATGAPNGLVIVKLMGRHSGYIACLTALASNDANLVLVPEVPFSLDGENGLFSVIRRRFEKSDHMLVIVAEGAGQDLLAGAGDEKDASGNVKLGDVGPFLKGSIKKRFQADIELGIRYIDPSYIIRAAPANPSDGIYCIELTSAAVHAAMAGRTDMVVGNTSGHLTHVPLTLATSGRKTVDPEGDLWRAVLENTGQPMSMTG